MNVQRKPRAVRAADLGRVLDLLAARGFKPHAVRVRPDGCVELSDAPLDAAQDEAEDEDNEWD